LHFAHQPLGGAVAQDLEEAHSRPEQLRRQLPETPPAEPGELGAATVVPCKGAAAASAPRACARAAWLPAQDDDEGRDAAADDVEMAPSASSAPPLAGRGWSAAEPLPPADGAVSSVAASTGGVNGAASGSSSHTLMAEQLRQLVRAHFAHSRTRAQAAPTRTRARRTGGEQGAGAKSPPCTPARDHI
jgi:hypothetical protein